ncbi:hypothetical protein [Kitasatospora sp. NPDC002965]|uniref:hypothetical protein n=1 Tax=Kitasatospora sp. NPDC002965 TaxID=3154775 RepID=UPI00339DF580
MKPAHLRRLGGAAAVAVAAGLLAAPTAGAAETGLRVTGTTASPRPGNVSEGVVTDACDATTAPGWIGRTTDGPTLRASVASDTAGTLSARFSVRDLTADGAAVFSAVREASAWNKEATTLVPGLVDGHGYAWNARALQGHKISAASPDCHFKVDLTSAQPTVSSPDFPPLGSGQTPGKYAGETAAFVISGTDPAPAGGGEASGLACYRYALNDSLLMSGGCDSGASVKPGPGGTVTLDVKVREWGTNVLYVKAVDNAGNSSFHTGYHFYAPSDPRPKPSAVGDVDGDAVPDILLPDTAGNLQIISGRANDTTPSSVLPADLAPGSVKNWNDYRVSHRDRNYSTADDLLVREVGGPGSVYLLRNVYGTGEFSRSGTGYVDWPRWCANPGPCAPGYPVGWDGVQDLVLPGRIGTTGPAGSGLLRMQAGDLWVATPFPGGGSFNDAERLTTGGLWAGYDLVTPGPDASGGLVLWARERADGALHAYAIPKKADGTLDFSALADPSAGVVATGFTVDAYPTLGSSGDLDGNGTADLWAVTADRHLVTYSGWTAPKDLGVLR